MLACKVEDCHIAAAGCQAVAGVQDICELLCNVPCVVQPARSVSGVVDVPRHTLRPAACVARRMTQLCIVARGLLTRRVAAGYVHACTGLQDICEGLMLLAASLRTIP